MTSNTLRSINRKRRGVRRAEAYAVVFIALTLIAFSITDTTINGLLVALVLIAAAYTTIRETKHLARMIRTSMRHKRYPTRPTPRQATGPRPAGQTRCPNRRHQPTQTGISYPRTERNQP